MTREYNTYKKFAQMPPAAFAALLLSMLVSYGACTPEANSTDSSPSDGAVKTLCNDYETIMLNDVGKLQNNVWGYESSSFTTYSQCVFYDIEQSGTFGWKWDLEGKSDYPSYPRIGSGWNPWDKESSGPDLLPRQVQSVSALVVSFDKTIAADGLYNTAFDIWLTGPDEIRSDTIVGEIMLWLDATQPQSATLITGDITIGPETYDFYKNTSWNAFPYLAFVKNNNSWDGKIDLMPFIAYLVENEHISPDAYIAEVEFGNEIWSGSGTMEVKNFSISVE